MFSTLYVLLSIIKYIFDDYPSYKYYTDQPEYKKMQMEGLLGKKRMRRLSKTGFYIATANMGLCSILILLKLLGLIVWW